MAKISRFSIILAKPSYHRKRYSTQRGRVLGLLENYHHRHLPYQAKKFKTMTLIGISKNSNFGEKRETPPPPPLVIFDDFWSIILCPLEVLFTFLVNITLYFESNFQFFDWYYIVFVIFIFWDKTLKLCSFLTYFLSSE